MALALAGAAPARATWSLVWSDEFNGTSLDAANWTADVGTGCPSLCGWGNAELEYYRTQNVAVTGGNLVITAKAENYGGGGLHLGQDPHPGQAVRSCTAAWRCGRRSPPAAACGPPSG